MDVHEYFSQLGKKSASRLTPDQRKQRASNAAYKRWMTTANGKHTQKEVANGKHEVTTGHAMNPNNSNWCDTHNSSAYRCGAKV